MKSYQQLVINHKIKMKTNNYTKSYNALNVLISLA
jgi:hypothetical protein